MDARLLLERVRIAIEENMDYYTFAAYLIESQKEEDARIAEVMGNLDIAAAIRA